MSLLVDASELRVIGMDPGDWANAVGELDAALPAAPQPRKQPIPSDFRWAVWERDDFRCQHCGSRRRLTVDHIHPESKGGPLTMDNAQTLCTPCNSRKGAR